MRQPLRVPETVSPRAPGRLATKHHRPISAAEDCGPISEDEAEAYAATRCFNAGPARRCGVELEWLVHDQFDAALPLAIGEKLAGTTTVYNGRLTIEPGGQVEYSSLAADDLPSCVEATARDMARLRAQARGLGVRLVGLGVDPYRDPHRVLDLPRYVAMERCFDREGSSGRWMMCSTASVQVCLDAGRAGTGPGSAARRWRLAHAIGPILVAAFANSPIARSRPTGWRSTRQAIWLRIDSTRTAPVLPGSPHMSESDPAVAWARYALDAKVLCIRSSDGRSWTPPKNLTFRSWVRRGDTRPSAADLDYHLSTLFPPVRPRGYLELRMIDAQRHDGWIVPLAVCSALLDNEAAGETALAATQPLWTPNGSNGSNGSGGSPGSDGPDEWRDPWRRAAQSGLSDPQLAAAARECFSAAALALPPGRAKSAVEAFTQDHVLAGRSPADNLLDEYRQATAHIIR
ncbi:MAG: ergothioneine biosynthesis glutamate--cysteine ligase EgtA [Micromonosporaceae bacterium]|nr:ergothioneine biosynthesis glutamate--cysteine ligase EgtA [Micromonosporaceae bacterium]